VVAVLIPVSASALVAGHRSAPNEAGVVDIVANLSYEHATAAGTGLVLTQAGEVLTNNHVIRGATSIRVVEPASGRSYVAHVVGYDFGNDVAVLQLKDASGLATVTPGNSSLATVGSPVTAVGNAGGVGGAPSVTTGTIVALDQAVTISDDQGGTEHLSGLIKTTAALQPGDSGGPLLDTAGQVLGIDTAAVGPEGEQDWAIPIDRALALAHVIEGGAVVAGVHVGPTPFLGIELGGGPSDAPVSHSGAHVVAVVPSSPAKRTGLVAGDVITSLDGQPIRSYAGITSVLLSLSADATISVGWTDNAGAKHVGQLKLEAGPPQ
jgi:S1-C subfamily serine protease